MYKLFHKCFQRLFMMHNHVHKYLVKLTEKNRNLVFWTCTLNICPLMDSSVFPPIGGAASPWAIRPIEEDVDIFDSSSDKDVPALGKSDPDASDSKTCDTEIFGK